MTAIANVSLIYGELQLHPTQVALALQNPLLTPAPDAFVFLATTPSGSSPAHPRCQDMPRGARGTRQQLN